MVLDPAAITMAPMTDLSVLHGCLLDRAAYIESIGGVVHWPAQILVNRQGLIVGGSIEVELPRTLEHVTFNITTGEVS